MTGAHVSGGENTAAFLSEGSKINWDLKKSGYTETNDDSTTTYTYQLVYRVRLKNESAGFTENAIYPTNDPTTLQYRMVQSTDGKLTVSPPQTINFPIPSVKGYLSELTFKKQDSRGQPLAGAEFTLSHDEENCGSCRGDATQSVTIADQTVISGSDGQVTFTNIPSGHKYTLTETKVPDGYAPNGRTYTVTVAYDVLTVQVSYPDGTPDEWKDIIVNQAYYELPQTGGSGIHWYYAGGLGLMLSAGALLLVKALRRRRGEDSS